MTRSRSGGRNGAAICPAWVRSVTKAMDKASRSDKGATCLEEVLPADVFERVLLTAQRICHKEPTVVDVEVPEGASINVVGDTHGQFHDLLRLFEHAGEPSEANMFIFNGDFVDRGAWGVEVLTTLAAWKVSFPKHVFLLRGNHESSSCTQSYGFLTELSAKYGGCDWKRLYRACKSLFSSLPLSSVVGGQTLVLHGGLFRKPAAKPRTTPRKRKPGEAEDDPDAIVMGDMATLRGAGKGGVDPMDTRPSALVASDVLWSDPQAGHGVRMNDERGVGLLFGPDATESFLHDNGLKLIIRSHEGPDSRLYRKDMKNLLEGYAVDHEVASGKLVTVFSAPDYPQFADEDERTNAAAAFVTLTHPDLSAPQFRSFTAVSPRPRAAAFGE